MNHAPDETLDTLGQQIDTAGMNGDADALLSLDAQCAERLMASAPVSVAKLWYYRSNVYAHLQDEHDPQSWDWRQPHRERQILYLRRALESTDFTHLV